MKNDDAGNKNRVQIAWQNVIANRKLRPADMINGFRMVHPLMSLAGPTTGFDVRDLALAMFTRMVIEYQPRPTSAPTKRQACASPPARDGSPRVGLFVDAPDHLSGVAMTLGEWRSEARQQGRTLIMHTCGSDTSAPDTCTFAPMGSIRLDAYAGLTLHVPRMDDVLRYIDTMPVDVVHVSTPGPMGLLGLLAARRRGLPVMGTYHTDFPRYAGTLTGDPELEETAWQFMRWFYGQLDRVAAPTESIRGELLAHGFDPARLVVVGRGVCATRFDPVHRSAHWRDRICPGTSLKLLYTGRLSREKNLATLADAFRRLAPTRPDLSLVFVGDGPYRAHLENDLRGLPVHFTGALTGNELATAYASSDLFVFPSLTDTFGRVVLEAQASGLPVVVAGQGGPRDAMKDRVTGRVVDPMNAHTLAEAIDTLTDDPARLARMARAARAYASTQTLAASFEAFWEMNTATIPVPTSTVIPQELRV